MPHSSDKISIYLEIGKKRTIAGALEWPGWCRVGRDEDSALAALVAYGPRYAGAIHTAKLAFDVPSDASGFAIAERLEGGTTTDFGAPEAVPEYDAQPLDDAELKRLQTLLYAIWHAFSAATKAADGKELRKGPRGGGRELEGIVGHVLGAEAGYLSRLAWKHKYDEQADMSAELKRIQQAESEALAAAAHGDLPEHGPRGGKIWKPRYFVRRAAWHILDHIWEIEDRAINET